MAANGWRNDLQQEFMKDSLQRRQELFRLRSYDRTVHPTQMYSLQAELALDAILKALIAGQPVAPALIERAAQELLKEYLGLNVSISSQQEADEILLDLAALTAGEQYTELFTDTTPDLFPVVLERLGWQQPAFGPGAPVGRCRGDGKRAAHGAHSQRCCGRSIRISL